MVPPFGVARFWGRNPFFLGFLCVQQSRWQTLLIFSWQENQCYCCRAYPLRWASGTESKQQKSCCQWQHEYVDMGCGGVSVPTKACSG